MGGGWVWTSYWLKTSFTKTGLNEGTGEGERWGLFSGVAILVGVGSSAEFRSTKGDDNRGGGTV
jgi:hypothetical protein